MILQEMPLLESLNLLSFRYCLEKLGAFLSSKQYNAYRQRHHTTKQKKKKITTLERKLFNAKLRGLGPTNFDLLGEFVALEELELRVLCSELLLSSVL